MLRSLSPLHHFSYPFFQIRQALIRLQESSYRSMTGSPPRASATKEPPKYPKTRRTNHFDTYQNKSGEVKVSDPYNWLERDTEERSSWLHGTLSQRECRSPAESAATTERANLTQATIGNFEHREKIKAELTKNWDFSRVTMSARQLRTRSGD